MNLNIIVFISSWIIVEYMIFIQCTFIPFYSDVNLCKIIYCYYLRISMTPAQFNVYAYRDLNHSLILRTYLIKTTKHNVNFVSAKEVPIEFLIFFNFINFINWNYNLILNDTYISVEWLGWLGIMVISKAIKCIYYNFFFLYL